MLIEDSANQVDGLGLFPLRLQPELDQASRPPNVAGFRPSIAGAADFVNKSIASLEAVRRNAGVLQRSDVQKHIRAAGVILDKAETALNILSFQHSSCPRLFPLRLRPWQRTGQLD